MIARGTLFLGRVEPAASGPKHVAAGMRHADKTLCLLSYKVCLTCASN